MGFPFALLRAKDSHTQPIYGLHLVCYVPINLSFINSSGAINCGDYSSRLLAPKTAGVTRPTRLYNPLLYPYLEV